MKYVIANWKMNLGIRESVALARGTLQAFQGKEAVPEVVICPSFTALAEVRKTLARTRMHLGAQSIGPGKAGAFTGEVGTMQLEDVGCEYVIVGHSERRHIFHEPEALLNEKLKAVFDGSLLTPILCVGEDKDVREAGKEEAFVAKQLKSALKDVSFSRRRKLLISYEPVWAIGSGKPATVADAVEMSELVRKVAIEETGASSDQILVLYGGSVGASNAYAFLREPSIDGLLVGGASLKIHEIHAILESASDVIAAQDSSV
jgi:triosephosphate isomerase